MYVAGWGPGGCLVRPRAEYRGSLCLEKRACHPHPCKSTLVPATILWSALDSMLCHIIFKNTTFVVCVDDYSFSFITFCKL